MRLIKRGKVKDVYEHAQDKLLLEVRNLSTHFQTYYGTVHAIDDVSLEIEKKNCVGLIGETGCGKTVTALSIMRLLSPEGMIVSGEVIFEGEDLLKKTEDEMRAIRGRKISMIFQEPTTSLNPVFTIGTQLKDVIMQHTEIGDEEDALERAIKLLELVMIPDAERRLIQYSHQLSVGMRQRVMIAMALSCNASLLIADEPTTSLDVTIEAQILSLMKHLQERVGTSMLYITHNLGVIAEISNMIGIMYAGNLVEYGTVKGIFRNPTHPYTRRLIAAIPERKSWKRKRLVTIKGTVPEMIDPPSGCRFHPRCPHAKKVCSGMKPKFFNLNRTHKVACHLFEGV